MNLIDPKIINDFPILERKINGNRLVYLDNAATTQKPRNVIDAISDYYNNHNANPHRGAYTLSVEATSLYDSAKETVKKFINANSKDEIIFTKNCTESLNLLAFSLSGFFEEGDEILLCVSEHHSNILPWMRLSKDKNLKLNYLYVNDEGIIPEKEYEKINNKTKLVSIAQMSNVLGTIFPVKKISQIAHEKGAIVVIDAAQSIPHKKVDVKDIDADFMVFSAHKMLGPMGIGVLYGKKHLLDDMPPFLLGGDMIEYVYEDHATYAEIPFKLEAGTQNVEGAFGLEAAIHYLEKIGLQNIENHEKILTEYAMQEMLKIPYINIYGPMDLEKHGGIISFNVKDVHPHDVSTVLDSYGISSRAGHHCCQPLMRYMGINASVRISFYLYNSLEDIDVFIESIKNVRKWLGYGS
ncbi:cysteine desulfurase [Soehngenia longivitae]|uniref:cysteine desulfurase n=1 Tax=Soehngenia longivitae TaxID=2562294 RepID=A0A4Z0D518_9FIRM|nr:cysteine desulfurase [Soehngenia longivitae]TFZ40206.1 cysteine desulfurase [Soehngenia longivitae]